MQSDRIKQSPPLELSAQGRSKRGLPLCSPSRWCPARGQGRREALDGEGDGALGQEGEGGGEKRSAVRWLMQRGAMADAVRCASTCSALRFPYRNDTFHKLPRSFSPDITLRPPWKSSSRAFGGFFFHKDNPILHPPKSALHAFGGFFFSPSNPFRSFQRSPPQPSAIAFQKQGFAFMTEAKPGF